MRMIAIAVVAGCAVSSPALAQVSGARSAPGPAAIFQPRLVPDVAPPPLLYQGQKPSPKSAARTHGATVRARHAPSAKPSHAAEIVCGLTLFRPSLNVDPRIRIHRDLSQGIRARRIEPDACGAPRK
jgi:hypothetical protein